MSEVLEDVQEELSTSKNELVDETSDLKSQDWRRESVTRAWPGTGGPSEIMEENASSSGRDFANGVKMEETFLTDPAVASSSSLYPSDVGNFQKPPPVGGWKPGHSSLTLENVDRVNRLGGQPFIEQSTLSARLAWGNRPVTPIKQLATPRSQLDPVLENVNYSAPLARYHPSYRPPHPHPDSPRSRGGRSIESRDTVGSMSVKEYRDSVYELSQNPWGSDVQRAVVTHAPRSVAPRNRQPDRMPRTIRKRYKDTFASTSERLARFGWGLIRNFWSWFAVIALVAAREGFREETLANQEGNARQEEFYSTMHRSWEPSSESPGDDNGDDAAAAATADENDEDDEMDEGGKENLTAESFMG